MTTIRALALLLCLTLLATACGGDAAESAEADDDGTPAPSADPARSDGDDAFPVTIDHRFGATTIEATPQRVVSVGFNDHDTILALGTVPVAVREWYGEFPSATWPWATDELGDAEPTVLSDAELDLEAVAAQDPDLIVGVFSGITEQEYDLLSQIAPTIASPEEFPDYGTPWRETTRIYGQALGVPDRAEAIIADIDAQLEQIRAANPQFEGAEAVAAFYASDALGAYSSADLRSRMLSDLGFTIPAEIDEAADGGFFAPVSLEQADLLDRDVVVWVTSSEEEIQALRDLQALDPLALRTEGREVVTDFLTNGAYSFSSPLSIPFLLDRLVPQLQAAVDGDPATEVVTPES